MNTMVGTASNISYEQHDTGNHIITQSNHNQYNNSINHTVQQYGNINDDTIIDLSSTAPCTPLSSPAQLSLCYDPGIFQTRNNQLSLLSPYDTDCMKQTHTILNASIQFQQSLTPKLHSATIDMNDTPSMQLINHLYNTQSHPSANTVHQSYHNITHSIRTAMPLYNYVKGSAALPFINEFVYRMKYSDSTVLHDHIDFTYIIIGDNIAEQLNWIKYADTKHYKWNGTLFDMPDIMFQQFIKLMLQY